MPPTPKATRNAPNRHINIYLCPIYAMYRTNHAMYASSKHNKDHRNRQRSNPNRGHPHRRKSRPTFIIIVVIITAIALPRRRSSCIIITSIIIRRTTLRLHIRLEKLIIIPDDVPRGCILADDIPPLRPGAVVVVVGVVSAVDPRAPDLSRRLPDQLREVARGLGEAGRLAEVVHPALVGPGEDGRGGVGVAAGEVFAVGAVLGNDQPCLARYIYKYILRGSRHIMEGREENRGTTYRMLPQTPIGPILRVGLQRLVPRQPMRVMLRSVVIRLVEQGVSEDVVGGVLRGGGVLCWGWFPDGDRRRAGYTRDGEDDSIPGCEEEKPEAVWWSGWDHCDVRN